MRNRSLVIAKFSQPRYGRQKARCQRRSNREIACQTLVIFQRYLTETIAAYGVDGLSGKLEITSRQDHRQIVGPNSPETQDAA